VDDLAKNLRRG